MSSKKNAKDQEGAPADERFSCVKRDPRFWEMPERERKIKIDKRFTSMFHDERFKVKYTVDKRGRPVERSTAEDLRRFYQISEDENDQEDNDDEEEEAEKQVKRGDEEVEEVEEEGGESQNEEGEESDSDSGDDSGPDLARGKGNVETSSDEDEEDVDGVLQREEAEIQHDWGELCKDAARSEQVWRRLAVCNVDWDRLKAKDLLAILNSFKPDGGAVLSVKIYPSEFGKERLRMEESQGPLELKALPDDSEDDTEDDRFFRERNRNYQFKRLKYYYAVAECNTAATAAKIYQECDGFEYESSCSVLDLRFIPDDMTFEDSPKDVATDVNLAMYTPKLFTSAANATSKVELTWDETDQERVSALSRKFNKSELLDMDFNAYLASSSEDDDVEEDKEEEGEQEDENPKKTSKSLDQMGKYQQLLRGLQDKEKKRQQEDKNMEMEITWVPGLKEVTEQLVKKKLEQKEQQLTPWADFMQKKKDKKKKKKTQKKDDNKDDELSDDQLPSDVDLDDTFFRQELAAVDMKTKSKDKKKRKNHDEERTADDQQHMDKNKAEMSLLMDDDDDDKHKHFNYDKLVEEQNLSKKKKKKMMKNGHVPPEDQFQVDVSDPRFQAVFTSHLFNLDPSHPSFKRTRATQSILDEKRRRRRHEEEQRRLVDDGVAQSEPEKRADRDVAPETSMDASLSLLVKSIKSKTHDFQARKKAKVL
ncbi:ESF1 homolog [Phyllopteryx taeniolatus]|uniref:ESF1 homolog n=1 Tax=Phyllopteryx taeniolatus TaxID=161469 RepID=UPI002AD3C309|nr:ESF1 homolog [Phyllopteryx taeniolatus]XP_061626139.1 ESF1 homolog [Phyllopteryx taeniolatus]XP_061626140.1 ESF1 homolog [Phyllopteryx taeniolatus]